jgi:uncharacterized DUF497 family protein
MEFEWDEGKDKTNQRKHGISFTEAAALFLDPFRIERHDGREEHQEDRWLTIGLADNFELVAVYTMRGESTRMISARKAEAHERKEYWKNR